jgi:hypothetical protein
MTRSPDHLKEMLVEGGLDSISAVELGLRAAGVAVPGLTDRLRHSDVWVSVEEARQRAVLSAQAVALFAAREDSSA